MVSVFRLPTSLSVANSAQGTLLLEELDGARLHVAGMGILSDGTPFLTQRGLAAMCGVENAHIGTISAQWSEAIGKPRINKIRDIVARTGIHLEEAHVEVKIGGRTLFAYGEVISLAILEYYAFEAEQFCQREALEAFRAFARFGFRKAVYDVLGYEPTREVDDRWRPFHDRVSLAFDKVPDGYFSVFKESADLSVTLGQCGVFSNQLVVPDISVGQAWGRHWEEQDLSARFGLRRSYSHWYPAYFPQSASNPQAPHCYPEAALGEFKRWMREHYIRGGKLDGYLARQVATRQVTADAASKALQAYGRPTLQIRSQAA